MDGVTLTYKKYSTNTTCEGVDPNFEEMRRMYPSAGGRFLNAVDVAQQRRVLVLGARIAKDIFKDEDPVGKTLLVDGLPFTLVGIIQDKIQTSMNNGPDSYRAIMPYTTFRTTYGPKRVNSIVVRPSDPANRRNSRRRSSGCWPGSTTLTRRTIARSSSGTSSKERKSTAR